MSAFKEMIERDNREVFLDLEYFADYHMIDGVEVAISLDTDNQDPKFPEFDMGKSDLVIFVVTKDLPSTKTPGEILNLDDREYTITDWRENKGVTEIHLSQPVMM